MTSVRVHCMASRSSRTTQAPIQSQWGRRGGIVPLRTSSSDTKARHHVRQVLGFSSAAQSARHGQRFSFNKSSPRVVSAHGNPNRRRGETQGEMEPLSTMARMVRASPAKPFISVVRDEDPGLRQLCRDNSKLLWISRNRGRALLVRGNVWRR